MRYPTTCARPTSKLPHPHSLSYFSFHSLPSPSQCQCDLWWSSRGIYSSLSGLVYNCSLHLWGLPPVLLPVDAGRVLPHKLEKLCVATNPLLSHSSVCVCMCVCMSGCYYKMVCVYVQPSQLSWCHLETHGATLRLTISAIFTVEASFLTIYCPWPQQTLTIPNHTTEASNEQNENSRVQNRNAAHR